MAAVHVAAAAPAIELMAMSAAEPFTIATASLQPALEVVADQVMAIQLGAPTMSMASGAAESVQCDVAQQLRLSLQHVLTQVASGATPPRTPRVCHRQKQYSEAQHCVIARQRQMCCVRGPHEKNPLVMSELRSRPDIETMLFNMLFADCEDIRIALHKVGICVSKQEIESDRQPRR